MTSLDAIIITRNEVLYFYIEGKYIGKGYVKGNRIVFGFFIICE